MTTVRNYPPSEILKAMKFIASLNEQDGHPGKAVTRQDALDYFRHLEAEEEIEHCPVCDGANHSCYTQDFTH